MIIFRVAIYKEVVYTNKFDIYSFKYNTYTPESPVNLQGFLYLQLQKLGQGKVLARFMLYNISGVRRYFAP